MDIKEVAKECIDDYLNSYYILEYGLDLDNDTLKRIVESYGYKLYGGDGYANLAIVINVKHRPYIDNKEVSDYINKKYDDTEEDILNNEIELFANTLFDEIPGFTIRGRMGGYWGLNFDSKDVQLSSEGKEELASRLEELYLEDTSEELDMVESITNILYNRIDFNDFDYELKPEIISKMKELEKLINAQEQDMNSMEYWTNE